MIPLTGEELSTLIKVRDLLRAKGDRDEDASMYARITHESLMALLQNSYLDTSETEVTQ